MPMSFPKMSIMSMMGKAWVTTLLMNFSLTYRQRSDFELMTTAKMRFNPPSFLMVLENRAVVAIVGFIAH